MTKIVNGDNGYAMPYRRRPRSMALSGPTPGAAPAGLGVRGIEVVQCIQNEKNDVLLVAGKPTLVRVYLDPGTVGASGTVTAELAWNRGGGEAYLPALNSIRLGPTSPILIGAQRGKLDNSLNFLLPPEARAKGPLHLRLSRVTQMGGSDLALAAPAAVDVTMVESAPLRIRVIGLRYLDSQQRPVSPAAIHFSYLQSFLLRAYPIAEIIWSQIVVDADFSPPFDATTADFANAQIAALRSREVSSGVDPKTHYYGLVDDNGSRDFMRGKAFAIPDSAQPDVVASGPGGVANGFSGDNDASYADWYGAHELGHTFGRFHPGFPPGMQDKSDLRFPYKDGCISPPDGSFVGVDLGDPALGLPMTVMPSLTCHDVMTYADNQWLSSYTYEAIHTRLTAENAL